MASTIRVPIVEDVAATYTAEVRVASTNGATRADPIFEAIVVEEPNNPGSGTIAIPDNAPLNVGTAYHIQLIDYGVPEPEGYQYGFGFFVFDEGDIDVKSTEAEAKQSFDLFRNGDKVEHQQDSSLTNTLMGRVTTTLRKILPQ